MTPTQQARIRQHGLRACCFALLIALLSGCAVVGRVDELPDGRYRVLRSKVPALSAEQQPLYIRQASDTLLLALSDTTPTTQAVVLPAGQHSTLLSSRLDVDVFTLPFKIRPARSIMPVQLNTSFNAALYLGRRLDLYHLHSPRQRKKRPPIVRDTGLGYGAFVGLGAAVINPDVTNQQTRVAEYEGMVAHAGAAFIYDARVFNIGLALGADHLFGPDGRHWIYQHKPWVGVLFGLDLN
ncbi:hypothetical protein [Solirubrum puertoriconensis]|uniref:Uncharacterized protein n=1 Tax=Solirubrum puertoriconensis TaxID=1751427 RepID=A0A9X0HHU2_SOLP1|nr:hypothetical protein [Solirubrum puertoriconensis]KUG06159.1 hypothetical protein ASU33_01980 [Solirubrum puertoriconensis]